MRYKERVIKHNIDIPELRTVGYSDMKEVYYDPSVISHHPRSFEYYFTHGIVVNEKRYIIKEFFVRESKLYAVITEDEDKYYELYLSFMEEDTIEEVKQSIEQLNSDLSTFRETDKELSTKLSTLLSKYTDFTNRLDGINGKLSSVESNIESYTGLTNRVSKLEEINNTNSSTNNSRFEETNNKLSALESNYNSLNDKNRSLETRVNSINELEKSYRLLSNRVGSSINSMNIVRDGNKVKIIYTTSNGVENELSFVDNDTINNSYNDTDILNKISRLEQSISGLNNTYTSKSEFEKLKNIEYKYRTRTKYPFDSELLNSYGGNAILLTRAMRSSKSNTYELSTDGTVLDLNNIYCILKFDVSYRIQHSTSGSSSPSDIGKDDNIIFVSASNKYYHPVNSFKYHISDKLYISGQFSYTISDNKLYFTVYMESTLVETLSSGEIKEYRKVLNTDSLDSRKSVTINGSNNSSIGYAEITIDNIGFNVFNSEDYIRVYKDGTSKYLESEQI